jgi:hypothetical protein
MDDACQFCDDVATLVRELMVQIISFDREKIGLRCTRLLRQTWDDPDGALRIDIEFIMDAVVTDDFQVKSVRKARLWVVTPASDRGQPVHHWDTTSGVHTNTANAALLKRAFNLVRARLAEIGKMLDHLQILWADGSSIPVRRPGIVESELAHTIQHEAPQLAPMGFDMKVLAQIEHTQKAIEEANALLLACWSKSAMFMADNQERAREAMIRLFPEKALASARSWALEHADEWDEFVQRFFASQSLDNTTKRLPQILIFKLLKLEGVLEGLQFTQRLLADSSAQMPTAEISQLRENNEGWLN